MTYITSLIFISIFIGICAVLILIADFFGYDLKEQSIVFMAFSAISNILMAFVAYWQLPAIEKVNRDAKHITQASFLLKLTEKWMHEDLIQARCLLHEHALKAKNKEHLQEVVSNYIIEISTKTDPETIRNFSRVISLLEFLETLAILAAQKHVTIDRLKQLFGGSLERYFYYLHPYINFRRAQGSPPGVSFFSDAFLYEKYENLAQALMDEDKNAEKST